MPKTDLVLTIPDIYDNDPHYFIKHIVGDVREALEHYESRSLASEYASRIRGYITKHDPQHWNFNTLCDDITGDYVDLHFVSHLKRHEIKPHDSHESVIEMLTELDYEDGHFMPVRHKRTDSFIIVVPTDPYEDLVQQTYDALDSDGYHHEARDFAQRMYELMTDFDPVSQRPFPVTHEEFWTLISEYVYITDPATHKQVEEALAA